MAKSDREISILIDRYRRIRAAKRSPSEIDTQALLVEPVLALAGWRVDDIAEIQRAKRSRLEEWDVMVREGELQPPRLVIEVKPCTLELSAENEGMIDLELPLALAELTEHLLKRLRAAAKWAGLKTGGEIAELRFCCFKLFLRGEYVPGRTIPVLTNGYRWVIFDSEDFVDRNRLRQPIRPVGNLTLKDPEFCSEILSRISKPVRTPKRDA